MTMESLRGIGRRCCGRLLAVIGLVFASTPHWHRASPYPKWDLFAGYQWLHPGGTVPAAFSDPSSPDAVQHSRYGRRVGGSRCATISIRTGRLEGDIGHNWVHQHESNYEMTIVRWAPRHVAHGGRELLSARALSVITGWR